MTGAAAGARTRCPACGEPALPGQLFCEACGAPLTGSAPVGPPPGSGPEAQRPGLRQADPRPAVAGPTCPACGGGIAADGYCEQCGRPAPAPRDHGVERPSTWVGGVCDRGVVHPRNEDAMSLAASPTPGGLAVLVVCDGVSSAPDSDLASLAAARRAAQVLGLPQPAGGAPDDRADAWAARMTRAAAEANAAVVEHSPAGAAEPPSCTFVAAVLDHGLLVTGCVGDSRAYWLPDHGEPRQLTTDDSWAQEMIVHGLPRAQAESAPQAHAITRWLGADAPDVDPRPRRADVQGPGWLLVCSDGLWNYCSAADDVARLVASTARAGGHDPVDLAEALVRWANDQGGRDNVTVALARLPVEGDGTAPPDDETTGPPGASR